MKFYDISELAGVNGGEGMFSGAAPSRSGKMSAENLKILAELSRIHRTTRR
jgi:hypothetical protein